MPDFSVSPSPGCGPIGDSAGPATQPMRMEETYHISDFFKTYSRFSYRNIHFIKKHLKTKRFS
jgi:hypothetical protein